EYEERDNGREPDECREDTEDVRPSPLVATALAERDVQRHHLALPVVADEEDERAQNEQHVDFTWNEREAMIATRLAGRPTLQADPGQTRPPKDGQRGAFDAGGARGLGGCRG